MFMSIKVKNLYPCILLLSASSLAFAYFVEYIMHLAACPLCIYQRFPYLIFILLSLISMGDSKDYNRYFIITALVAILLAGYHTGVERGIFELSSLCTPLVSVTDNLSVSDFKKMLYSQQLGMCNKPALVIFGLSMTEWNLLLNLILLTIFIRYTKYRENA